jgi:hypothetical protein
MSTTRSGQKTKGKFQIFSLFPEAGYTMEKCYE